MTIRESGDAFDVLALVRLGNGARVNRNRQWEWLGTDVRREDYDPITLAPRGLLLEGGRTNSIPNSEAVGAVPGTPGTPPSGSWDIFSAAGSSLATEIVATGTEDGIPYLDVRFSGTNALGGPAGVGIRPCPQNTIIVAQNQVWTGSFFCALIAGSVPAGVTFNSFLYEAIASGGVSSGGGGGAAFLPVLGERLINSRRSYTRTMAGADTVRLFQQLRIAVTNGVAIDFTLRFGLPQLELGAFASSPIKTSSAAGSRAGDVCSIPVTDFPFNPAEGTILVDAISAPGGVEQWVATLSDGGTQNFYSLARRSTAVEWKTRSAGVDQGLLGTGNWPASTLWRIAATYKADDFALCVNGGTVYTDTSGLPTAGITTLYVGSLNNGAQFYGHIRKLLYFPRRLSNAELQARTA